MVKKLQLDDTTFLYLEGSTLPRSDEEPGKAYGTNEESFEHGEDNEVALAIPHFSEISGVLVGMIHPIKSALQAVHVSSATVEFGLNLDMKPGMLLATLVNGQATASIKVTLVLKSS